MFSTSLNALCKKASNFSIFMPNSNKTTANFTVNNGKLTFFSTEK